MNLKEIKEKKAQLEKNINDLIESFYLETNIDCIQVRAVNLPSFIPDVLDKTISVKVDVII